MVKSKPWILLLPLFMGFMGLFGCSKTLFREKWTEKKAPENFKVRFLTSRGDLEVEITRSYSPLAVDRFYQLVRYRVLDHSIFYRVVPRFVAQFGSPDSLIMEKWGKYKVPDEKVISSNLKGTLSFARGGKDTRGSELFFNLKDNTRLDTVSFLGVKGFPVIGKITGA